MTTPDTTALDALFRVDLPPRPYPGLRPFEKDEWPIFFGRERMADAIVAQLIDKRLLVVHGDSGCGKSSLIRAAVLPRLEQESARGGVRWRTCIALPREAPLWNLAEALAGLDGDAPNEERVIECRRVLNYGRGGPDELASLLGVGPDNHLCILIDQFEELFDHAHRHGLEEAQLLTEFLVTLLERPPAGLYAVLTMRSEFLGACARFGGFAEAVNATQYLLPRMGHEDLLRAICVPAQLFDGEISLALAECLISDSGGGQDQLPLIQHGLMLLHRKHVAGHPDAEDKNNSQKVGSGPTWRLGLEHYHDKGGLAGLLSAHADTVQEEAERTYLQPGSRTVEDLFRALTDINSEGQAIRRPRTLEQLITVTGADEASLRSIVDRFRADGVSFLRPHGNRPFAMDELIDISHEALIRCWHKIADPSKGWLNREFRTGLVWRALLVQAESFDRDPGNVLSPAATDERERWLRRRNPAWAERYGGGWERVQQLLAASAAARDRERVQQAAERRREEESRRREQQLRSLKWGLSALVILLLVTTSLGYFAWQQSLRATAASRQAITELRESQLQFAAVEAARERNEKLEQYAQQSADALRQVGAELERAVAESTPSPTLAKTLSDAKVQLKEEVRKLDGAVQRPVSTVPTPRPSSASPPPRVYIQIAEEAQRADARALELKLETLRLDGSSVIVPGIEFVKASPPRSVLRCFQPMECKAGGELVQSINRLLRSPEVAIEDLSRRYGDAGNIRPRHYELWFAPGEIRLEPE